MNDLGLPLDEHQLRRLARLERSVGVAYGGWGRDRNGAFFVDVGEHRYCGGSLHYAIGKALRARGAHEDQG